MPESLEKNGRAAEVNRPMFRAMKAQEDGFPQIGRTSRQLGVRIDGPTPDLVAGHDGMVDPGTGGMSVALDVAQNLPKPRLPKSLGGEGRDAVFTMFTADVSETLLVRLDHYPHALVEPSRRCHLRDFESYLASTRSLWSKAHE